MDASNTLAVTSKDSGSQPAEPTELLPEMREISESWLTLNPGMREAIMAIVRSSRRGS